MKNIIYRPIQVTMVAFCIPIVAAQLDRNTNMYINECHVNNLFLS